MGKLTIRSFCIRCVWMSMLFYPLMIVSCTSGGEKEKHFYGDRIEDVRDKIKEIDLKDVTISPFGDVYIIGCYFLVKDYKSKWGLVYIFKKDNFQYLGSAIRRGRGQGEIANIGDICVDEKGNKIYVFDHGKSRLFGFDMDSILTNPNYEGFVKADLRERMFPDRCSYVNDTMSIVAITHMLDDHNRADELAGIWNMTTGDLKVGYENPDVKKRRFSFDASSENEVYVKCYSRYDLMTICALDGSLKCDVYGPQWSKSITNTCHYNMDVQVCGNRIFALYSGGDWRTKDFYPSWIRVFDTDGNYLKTLDTGFYILHFCYDKDNNRIILYTYDEKQFVYLDLEGII